MSGELNGTNLILQVLIGSTWTFVGGEKTHTDSGSLTPIDITNKGSNSYRELMSGEGLMSKDVSAEFVFSSDAAFAYMQTAAQTKTIEQFRMFDGSEFIKQTSMIVASVARTSPDGDATTATVTLQSTGEFDQDGVGGSNTQANAIAAPSQTLLALNASSSVIAAAANTWIAFQLDPTDIAGYSNLVTIEDGDNLEVAVWETVSATDSVIKRRYNRNTLDADLYGARNGSATQIYFLVRNNYASSQNIQIRAD